MNQLEQMLDGAWRVKELAFSVGSVKEDIDRPEFLWFDNGTLVAGDRSAAWDTPYTLHGGVFPAGIEVERTDRFEQWMQKGVVSVNDDILRLCLGKTPASEIPTSLNVKSEEDAIIYTAERCEEPIPE